MVLLAQIFGENVERAIDLCLGQSDAPDRMISELVAALSWAPWDADRHKAAAALCWQWINGRDFMENILGRGFVGDARSLLQAATEWHQVPRFHESRVQVIRAMSSYIVDAKTDASPIDMAVLVSHFVPMVQNHRDRIMFDDLFKLLLEAIDAVIGCGCAHPKTSQFYLQLIRCCVELDSESVRALPHCLMLLRSWPTHFMRELSPDAKDFFEVCSFPLILQNSS